MMTKAENQRPVSLPFGQYAGLLVSYLKPQRLKVCLLAGLIFGSVGLQLANPLVIRYFLDTAQAGGQDKALLLAAGLFIAFSVVQQVVSLGADYLGESVSWSATNRLRADLTHHILGLDMAFHKKRTPGELIERVDGDVGELGSFFSQLTLNIMANLLLITGVLAFMFREDWRMGAGMAVYAGVTLAALGGLQKLGVKQWNEAREAEAGFSGFLEERLAGTEDIRANGAEGYVLRSLLLLMRRLLTRRQWAHLMGVFTYIITYMLYVVGYALGIGLGTYLYLSGKATIGTAYLILYYITLLKDPLQAIRAQVSNLQRASASLKRVNDLMELRPAVQPAARSSDHLPSGSLSIRFRNVSFAYQDEGSNGSHEPVLNEISFQCGPGQVIGLLGRTGSGKTTLTRLITRLYDPQAGVIELGGKEIGSISLADIRQRVGMVTQDVQLFQAALRDNISFFDPQIPDELILHVIGELGLWEWYKRLPAGLDTRLGTNGSGLSAGEAQLLALTRVFLKDPGLVILDEASSRLDPATERWLEQAIHRLLQGRTGLVVAHRLATVQGVDEIMILEGGQIEEYGRRERLAGDPRSHFARLLQTGLEERLI
jgi:ABC-type multidrug transport system fused ATPase/permease subunit